MLARVVTADSAAPLARRVVDELGRGKRRVRVEGPAIDDAEGLIVLLDDDALPQALHRLITLLPGRAVFPNVILVLEKAEATGGLLAEGFRDIVAPGDLDKAIDHLLGGLPPMQLVALRKEIEQGFLPDYARQMRQHAQEKQALLTGCVDLVRAASWLERRVYKLKKLLHKQSLGEMLVARARIESYQTSISGRNLRLHKLPAFPEVTAARGSSSSKKGGLGRREPRVARHRELLEETIESLRQTGLLDALGKQGHEQIGSALLTFKTEPLAGLRETLSIVETDITAKLAEIDELRVEMAPVAALEARCLERHGFGILPPGIVVPSYVRMIVQSLAQPPAEIYLTWSLDLRDLRFRLCSDVLGEVSRELARESNAARRKRSWDDGQDTTDNA